MIPTIDLFVVNFASMFAISGLAFVKILKREDFPVFVEPIITACMSSFLIPRVPDFDDNFLLFSIFSFNFLYLVFNCASIFSADLCFGHSLIISSKKINFSLSDCADKN